MSKRTTNIDWQAILEAGNPNFGKAQDQGPDYNLDPIGCAYRPTIKVPLDMLRRLEVIAKASHMEVWEVVQSLIEYRFKESA